MNGDWERPLDRFTKKRKLRRLEGGRSLAGFSFIGELNLQLPAQGGRAGEAMYALYILWVAHSKKVHRHRKYFIFDEIFL